MDCLLSGIPQISCRDPLWPDLHICKQGSLPGRGRATPLKAAAGSETALHGENRTSSRILSAAKAWERTDQIAVPGSMNVSSSCVSGIPVSFRVVSLQRFGRAILVIRSCPVSTRLTGAPSHSNRYRLWYATSATWILHMHATDRIRLSEYWCAEPRQGHPCGRAAFLHYRQVPETSSYSCLLLDSLCHCQSVRAGTRRPLTCIWKTSPYHDTTRL